MVRYDFTYRTISLWRYRLGLPLTFVAAGKLYNLDDVLFALCMVESRCRNIPSEVDDDSFGPMQVRHNMIDNAERVIKAAGYEIPTNRKSFRAGLMYGVAVFKIKFFDSRRLGGGCWGAVRLYNGAGDGGKPGIGGGFLHLKKVRSWHFKLFAE